MTILQLTILQLLAAALTSQTLPSDYQLPEGVSWNNVWNELEQQRLISLVFPLLEELDIPSEVFSRMERSARKIALQNYHLFFTAKYLIEKLEKAGIPVVLLKGNAAGRYYSIPEVRKTSDVDLLLLDRSREDDANQIFREAGLITVADQHARHHQEWRTTEDIIVELHTDLIESFDEPEADNCIRQQADRIPVPAQRADIMGISMPVLPQAYEAYHLLLHMLQHFVRQGFGIRLLCDWVVFWNRELPTSVFDEYLALVHESGIKRFHQVITSICVRYLGLSSKAGCMQLHAQRLMYSEHACFCELIDADEAEHFVEDMFSGGDFGTLDKGRTVSVDNNSLQGYMQQFHRQMLYNHPKMGRYFILWPVLWIVTLVVFLRNNRKYKRGSLYTVLKRASQRGSLHKSLKLFKKDV